MVLAGKTMVRLSHARYKQLIARARLLRCPGCVADRSTCTIGHASSHINHLGASRSHDRDPHRQGGRRQGVLAEKEMVRLSHAR